jgi:hypothetical protein
MYWYEGTSVLRLLVGVSVADPNTYVLGLPVPDQDQLVRGTDPDPSIIKQK